MKVLGLDGKTYRLRLGGVVQGEESRRSSSYHKAARELLRRLFPLDRIHEEVFLPGLPTASYADFLLPLRVLMVEVQGEQHSDPDHHFHGGRMGFLRAKSRDLNKQRWCELNGYSLVELDCTETVDVWAERILAAHGGSTNDGE